MTIIRSRRAVADLADVADPPLPRNQDPGVDDGAAIRSTVRRIARHPRSCRLQDDGSLKAVVPPHGYVILPDIRQASIEIIVVRHGARKRPTQDP